MNNICRVTELRDREVINICDGRRLGFVCDVEIDICSGKVIALIVPEDRGCFSLAKTRDIRIPWDKIDRIGEDIILVSLPPSEIKPEEHKHKWFN